MKNPLHYQLTEYDCGPTSVLNAVSYLFEREEIPPEIVRNVMLYCLDLYGSDGVSGKSGTSPTAMLFLGSWLNGFSQTGRLPISCVHLSGREVHLRLEGRLRDALRRRGAAVVRVDLEGLHYVLLTGIEGELVYLFDPYYQVPGKSVAGARVVETQPFACNRIVPASLLDSTDITPYAMGPADQRDALLLFNDQTVLRYEDTVEYMI